VVLVCVCVCGFEEGTETGAPGGGCRSSPSSAGRSGRDSRPLQWAYPTGMDDVDKYGVPLDAFGATAPPAFFELLGRILAVSAKIEYLKARLDDLPASETSGVRKVEQFLERETSERTDRNAIVHSRWVFGAHTSDPGIIVGMRYKIAKTTSGLVATVSIRDVPDSEREQDIVQYEDADLRMILKRSLQTIRIGEIAYSEVMLTWSAQHVDLTGP
jgi:hypothetical protein